MEYNLAMNRDIDETGAGGAWDFAYEVAQEIAEQCELGNAGQEIAQEIIYNAIKEQLEQ